MFLGSSNKTAKVSFRVYCYLYWVCFFGFIFAAGGCFISLFFLRNGCLEGARRYESLGKNIFTMNGEQLVLILDLSNTTYRRQERLRFGMQG